MRSGWVYVYVCARRRACVREGRCWGQVRQWTKHGFVRLFAKGRRETSGDGDNQVCGDNKWGSGERGGRCADVQRVGQGCGRCAGCSVLHSS